MKTIADLLGSVMTAVNLPREMRSKNLETYVKTEFQPHDRASVLDCMLRGDSIDRRNIV